MKRDGGGHWNRAARLSGGQAVKILVRSGTATRDDPMAWTFGRGGRLVSARCDDEHHDTCVRVLVGGMPCRCDCHATKEGAR